MLLRVLPVSVIFSIAAYAAVVERVGHVVAVLAAIVVFFLASLGSALLILALTEKVGEGLASFYFPSGRSTPAPKDFSEEKALVARGRVDAALAMVEARLHATPDDAEACIFAADLHAREAGQPRQAESLFRRARDSRRVTAAQDLYATQRLSWPAGGRAPRRRRAAPADGEASRHHRRPARRHGAPRSLGRPGPGASPLISSRSAKHLSRIRGLGRFSCEPGARSAAARPSPARSRAMRRPRIFLAIPTLLALLAAGCDSSPLEPGEVAAEYLLESVNGSPLPAVTWNSEPVSHHLLSETLRLRANGEGTHTRVVRVDWADPAKADEVSGGISDLTYSVRGERIEITYFCPPNALCAAGPHAIGRVEGATLVLTVIDGNMYRYRRD